MTVGSVRSGLVESFHPVSAVAVGPDGEILETLGENLDREFFYRSAPKPLQAFVSQRLGAALGPEQLAVASASHRGYPVHVSYVEDMLAEVGLRPEEHLRCPPDRPAAAKANRLWASLGRPDPERVFHNCSGKHTGMLRACVAQDWPLDYTVVDHPVQREVAALAAECSGASIEPVGVDGCGIPTLRGDVLGLARIFGRLVTDPRFIDVTRSVARFTSLTSSGESPEAHLSRWLPAVVKGGAAGCLGLGLLEHQIAFAVKSWSGAHEAAGVALVEIMDRVGVLPPHQREMLDEVASPVVLGGGHPVGSFRLLGG